MTKEPYCHRLPPEILCAVFNCLGTEDLTSCALTCKRWSGPAMQTKWSILWVPLEALLTTTVAPTTRSPPPAPYSTYILDLGNVGVAEVDWDLLRDRAAQVSRIRINDIMGTRLGELILQGGSPLLPNLRRLSVSNSSHFEMAFNIAVSPSLNFVEFRAEPDFRWGPQNETMIKRLAKTTPNLEVLSVLEHSADISYICAFHSLRTLRYVGNIGYAEWNMLAAQCPKLETLALSATPIPAPASAVPVEDFRVQPCFPSLQALELKNLVDDDFDVTILENSTFSKLGRIGLVITLPPYRVARYIDPLTSKCPEIDEVSFEIPHYVSNSALSFMCLAGFRALRRLTLLFNRLSAQLQHFLSNFPNLFPDQLPSLRHFAFQVMNLDGTSLSKPVGITWDSLHTLLLRMPLLRSLEIPLNVRVPLTLSSSSNVTVSTVKDLFLNPLTFLNVTGNHESFAANLAVLLPAAELSSASTISFAKEQYPGIWETVGGAGDAFNAFRKSFREARTAVVPQ